MAVKPQLDQQKLDDLQARLQEAEDTLEAIRKGTVDALVVTSKQDHEIFTLRSADYTYRVLIESMNQGALTISFDGTILYSNKQFSTMLEAPLEKVIGCNIIDFIIPADRPTIQVLLDSKHGAAAKLEINLCTVSRQQLTVIASITTVQQPDVKPYLCVVVTDMTERKQAEDAKDEFISLASHQLRTPATSVKQYVNMVLDGMFGDITAEQRSALERANSSNERELKIVEDLLKVAQIDAGKIILNRTSTDVGLLLSEVIQEQTAQINARQQTVMYQSPNIPVTADIDAVLMRMVIENLIDNASKYMDDSGTITLTAKLQAGQAVVAISDQGVGMSDQDISKLFQKFSRLPNSLSIKVGGNGLGLYWVKKVIDLHQASIEVSSKVAKGTTFTITLPSGETYATHPRR